LYPLVSLREQNTFVPVDTDLLFRDYRCVCVCVFVYIYISKNLLILMFINIKFKIHILYMPKY